MKNTSLELIRYATDTLQKALKENKVLCKKIRQALKKPSYTVKTILGKRCNSCLLFFLGTTGGHGIILLKDYNGEPIFWVSCPTPNTDFDVCDIGRRLWSGEGRLPNLVREELKKLKSRRGVEGLLKRGLRS